VDVESRVLNDVQSDDERHPAAEAEAAEQVSVEADAPINATGLERESGAEPVREDVDMSVRDTAFTERERG
jgi:hypothetical protein